MRILLTGACGVVGRAILRAAGDVHDFVCVDISPRIDEIAGGIRACVSDFDAMRQAAEGCDAIIHTAAMHGAFKGKASNKQFIDINITGSDNLFQAALANGIKRLVVSSTLEVLCGQNWLASGRTIYTDDSPPRPDWIYPITKHMVEEMGHAYARSAGLEIVQLRYAWVRHCGIRKIGLSILSRSVADSDVAEANLLSATKPGLTDHVFNICPEAPLTQADIDLAHTDPWAVLEKYWPGSSEVLQLHGVEPRTEDFWPITRIDSAKQVLGWQPQVTIETYLRTLGWRPPAAAEEERESAEKDGEQHRLEKGRVPVAVPVLK